MRRSPSSLLWSLALSAVLNLTALIGATAGGLGPAVAGYSGATLPVTDPATLCVAAFNDADADGVQGPGEEAQSGWVVTIKDGDGVSVGSIVTDALTPACINLATGSYVVTERLQPSWLATTTGHASQTLTLVSAATTTVTFGNRRCCSTFTFRAGKADDFSLANGARAELVSPISATATPMYFDATKGNRVLAQRFRLGTANCVESATLRMRLRALPGGSTNDTVRVRVPGGGSWSMPIAGVSPAGPWVFRSTRWTVKTIVVDLGAMPPVGGASSLLPALNATHVLDVIVRDDTSVDYIRLVVAFGGCHAG